MIDSEEMCKHAAKKMRKTRFSNAIGPGTDLPHGCVWHNCGFSGVRGYPSSKGRILAVCNDAVGPAYQDAVFWNPNGSALSMDTNIRQVCYEPYESFKGIIFRICCIKLNF